MPTADLIGASLYILICTARNRTTRWLKRLREPRYSVALVAGAAYLWFVFRAQSRRRDGTVDESGSRVSEMLLREFPALAAVAPSLAGFGLLIVAAASWLFPGTGGLIDFTPAEGQFLFTAPVSTRMLLVHRMIRSQIGVLFGPLVFVALVPFGSDPQRIRMAVTLWIVLFTARMYFSAAALARAGLRSSGRGQSSARLLLLVVVGALIVAAVPIARVLLVQPLPGFNVLLERMASATSQPLVQAALWPATALVRPAFTANWGDFFAALPSALLVSVIVCGWLLVNAPKFEDVIRNVSEQRVDQPKKKGTSYRARNIWWKLAPTGRAEAAFAWKSMVQTFRIAEVRILIRLTLVFVWIAFIASMQNNAAAGLGAASILAAGICTLLGPLILRIDLRQDLKHLEVLKTWPVRPAALIRGEMLWPATLLTVVVWMLTLTAFLMSESVFSTTGFAMRVSLAVSFSLLAPALIATQLTVHNAAALVFPAWVSFGNWRSRGVEAMGQRLIVVGGTILLVTIAAIPGAILGGITWLALTRFIGPPAYIPAAAVCALTMGIEVLFVTEALGPAYERIDLTGIERTE